MKIHPTTLVYDAYPSVYNILESTLFMWFIVAVTLGMFYKPLWIIAVLAIVTDWDKLQQWIRGASQ